jgi:hypothetical protein
MIQSILSGEYLVLAMACEACDRDGRAVVWPEGTRVRDVETDVDGPTTIEAEWRGEWKWQMTTQSPKDLVKWAGKLSVSHHDEKTGEEVR